MLFTDRGKKDNQFVGRTQYLQPVHVISKKNLIGKRLNVKLESLTVFISWKDNKLGTSLKKKLKNDSFNSSKTFSFDDNLILPIIYGEKDKFLDKIEDSLDVQIITRGNIIKVTGSEENVNLTKKLLDNLYNLASKNHNLDEGEIFKLH